MKRVRLFLLLGALFLAFISFGPSASAQEEGTQGSAAPEAQSAYAGSEECAACHEELAVAFKRTIHASKAFEMRSTTGCETCHGPAQAHIEGGGDVTQIKSFKALKASEASAVCMECHQDSARAHWEGNVHQQRGVSCLDCHTVHHSKSEKAILKTATAEQTCYTCHSTIKAQAQRTSHHPIREGLLSCVNCHNPHGSQTPKMLSANSTNDLCYTCHTEKRGPHLWEHPPVRENCLNCHAPHGSNHPKLLVSKRPYLCQNCHLDTRHPGTLYDGTSLVTSNREFARSCSNCHLTIHGSNHPSGWTFLR